MKSVKTHLFVWLALLIGSLTVQAQTPLQLDIPTHQQVELDFTYGYDLNLWGRDVGVRHRNTLDTNTVTIIGFDLTPITFALTANPDYKISAVTIDFRYKTVDGGTSGGGATYKLTYTNNNSYDSWDAKVLTPARAKWNNFRREWRDDSTSTVVGSFDLVDRVGTLYQMTGTDPLNMVQNDGNRYVTMIIWSPITYSGWFTRRFYNPTLHVILSIPSLYVDKNYTGVELGTPTQPYNTLQEALDAAKPSEKTYIYIRAFNYNEFPKITKPVRLLNWGDTGIVRIGTP